jgi:hypothetical protein
MLSIVTYVLVALCFISSVVLCSIIPNKIYKFLSLVLLSLIFIIGVTVMMVKVSGQPNISSFFNSLSVTQENIGMDLKS